MGLRKWIALALILVVASVGAAAGQRSPQRPVERLEDVVANYPLTPDEKGGLGETGPYVVVPNHFKPPLPEGWSWGPLSGIYAESPDRVYVYGRGIVQDPDPLEGSDRGIPREVTPLLNIGSNKGRREFVLTVYDRSGNMIENWKHLEAMHQEPMSSARRLRVNPWDPDKHLWLIDIGANRIVKVTRQGKVVMTVGSMKRDKPLTGANGYQDMAFLPNGDFWALESAQAAKFSKDGVQLGPVITGLATGFSIAIDGRGRIYIGERFADRIRVFDSDGKQIDTWPNIRFGGGFLALDKKDRLWVYSAIVHRIAGFNLDGKLLYSWGVTGMHPGQLFGVSQFSVDREGNLYMAERYGGKLQMFRPKKGADPNQLIAELWQ